MGSVFSNIGQGISNAVDWAGDKAKAAGQAVEHGADVAYNATANTVAGAGAAASNAVPSMVGLGKDAKMLPQVGKSEGYPGKWAPNEQVPKQIKVKIPYQRGAQQAASVANAQTGSSTTVQAPGASFLYLDVGRWGGNGGDAKRDFGIVCGRTVALCAFTQGSTGSYTDFSSAVTKLTDGPQDEIGPINALLGLLAGSPLGTPKVRRYLTSKAPLPAGVDRLSQRVYVIVGDMHLPVTTGACADGAQPPEQVELKGRRVGRARRTDAFKGVDVMSDSDASLWHERYVKAEIFQQAGPDLSSLVGMLAKAKGNVGAELWLMQLGDMFDLWLGFDCFLAPDPPKSSGRPGNVGRVRLQDLMSPAPTPPATPVVGVPGAAPVPVADPSKVALQDVRPTAACTAVEFIDFWINRSMYKTTQASHVRDFLQFDPNASKFLHGNHDNYLYAHAPSELMKLRGGQGLANDHHDAKALFYACHGHEWDSYNRDGATAGLGTTQAAFWAGQWVRSLEPDDRESSLLGAVDLFRSGKKPFNVFAMGHTHTAILTEIVIEIEPEPPPPPPPDTTPIGP